MKTSSALNPAKFQKSLGETVQRILAVFSPKRIILFGSQARGDADAGSDIDLMVIEPTVENTALEAARLYRAVGWEPASISSFILNPSLNGAVRCLAPYCTRH